MSAEPAGTVSDIPETLLSVIVEAARGVLQGRDSDALGPTLRPLARVDRRAASSSTVRRQFAAALARDDAFRGDVAAAVRARPDVTGALDGWNRLSAVDVASRAADTDGLAALVAALWAAAPDGWDVGIGACAAVEAERRARGALVAERDALAARVGALESDAQARTARDAARTNDIDALNAKVTAERAARRKAEQRADETTVALDAAHAADAQLRDELAAARTQHDAARARAGELERALTDARADSTRNAPTSPPSPVVSARDLADLADAAADLTHRLRDAASRTETASAAPPAAPRTKPPRTAAPARRTKPPLPGGLVADTVEGARAMLAGGAATLVVDGYNVSKQAWPDATAMMQRDRLELGLQQVHQRCQCAIVCCYDGADDVGVSRRRTSGVRVRFSARDQEADELVVEAVRELPKRVPAVVASSDAWVREHAEAEGAVVVSAATAAALIAAAGRR